MLVAFNGGFKLGYGPSGSSQVAGYLYIHHRGGPTAVPVVPGQLGIPNRLLAPYTRDFFTIIANSASGDGPTGRSG